MVFMQRSPNVTLRVKRTGRLYLIFVLTCGLKVLAVIGPLLRPQELCMSGAVIAISVVLVVMVVVIVLQDLTEYEGSSRLGSVATSVGIVTAIGFVIFGMVQRMRLYHSPSFFFSRSFFASVVAIICIWYAFNDDFRRRK
jgi:hypothetical protein